MKANFKERMNKAIESAIQVARKEDEKYLEKVRYNQQLADLYIELVLAFVEKFDFHTGRFHSEKIDANLLEKFGQPKEVHALISEESKEGIISLDYRDKTGWLREGEPKFKESESFDLKIINNILSEYNISIYENHVDSGGYGGTDDRIRFDASMLLEKRNELAEELPMQYKKINKKVINN